MKTPFLGASYVARSVNAADNRCINLFPEAIPEGGKEPGFLNRAPGLRYLQTVGTGPIRGLYAHENNGPVIYVVSGIVLYKLTGLTSTPVQLGLIPGYGPVSIAYNGRQLFIARNGPSYIYDESAGTFSAITDPDFPGAGTVCYIDGYFIFNQPDTQFIWATSLLEGTEVDALDFASAEGFPDGVVAVAADHNELWVFGNNTVEVWYNAALSGFPFARIQGALNEIGLAARYSVAKLDNTLFWLGADPRGQGIVYKSQGYTGRRISTHAIEYAIQQYSYIADAIAYSYQQEGHTFYVLTFPTANATWVYDVSTDVWHERAGYSDGTFTRHRSNCHCNVSNTSVVGDYESGKLYALDLDVFADDGQVQKWLRSWRALPTKSNTLLRTTQHSLQLDMESGTGLSGGTDPGIEDPRNLDLDFTTQRYFITTSDVTEGLDPQVMLRWSDDGGHTWSNEHWKPTGKFGEHAQRVIWRRLGMTTKLRDRVYEVSGTDPVKITLLGAELVVSGTKA